MRWFRLERTFMAGGVALVLVGATIGLALAQQAPPPSPPATTGQAAGGHPGQVFRDALARQLGVTADRLQEAVRAARSEVGLPAQGGRPRPGPGCRPGGRGYGFVPFGMGIRAAADAIGISVDQLHQQLPGKSLAQVAQAHGKNPADIATALKNDATQRIDQAGSSGRLTADRASQLREDLAQRIDRMINQVMPEHGPGRPGGFRRPGGGASGGGGPNPRFRRF